MQQLEILTETSRILPMRWRSLLFDKDGNSYLGKKSYDNQAVCLEATAEIVANSKGKRLYDLSTQSGILAIEDYSWHMAIPELL